MSKYVTSIYGSFYYCQSFRIRVISAERPGRDQFCSLLDRFKKSARLGDAKREIRQGRK